MLQSQSNELAKLKGNENELQEKLALIEDANPAWRDLAEDYGFDPLIGKKVNPGSSPG